MKKELHCPTTRSFIAPSLYCSILLALAATLSAAPPPELITVQQQYEKAVIVPHVAEKAALDTKFIAALTNAATAAKQAGHLDEVLAIRAEQKRLTEKLPIPDDDAGIPESLKKLRGIYREQLTKIEAQRTANHNAMLPDYTGKLKDLEIHLTRSDRIEDAMEVKAYRESLATGSLPIAGTDAPPPPATDSKMANTNKTTGAKGDDRAAAEWLLSVGGSMVIQEGGKQKVTLPSAAGIPKGRFQLLEIILDGRKTTGPVTGEGLKALAGLENVKTLVIVYLELTDEELSVIGTFPNLTSVEVSHNSQFTGAALQQLAQIRSLTRFCSLKTGITDEAVALLANCKTLTSVQINECSITDACIPHLNKLSKLSLLGIANNKITPEGLAQLTVKPQSMSFNITPGESLASVVAVLASTQPQLTRIDLDYTIADDSLSLLKDFRKLTTIQCTGGATEALLNGLDGVPGLVDFKAGPYFQVTDTGLMKFVPMKKLKNLTLNKPNLTDAGVAAFKKARPEVNLVW